MSYPFRSLNLLLAFMIAKIYYKYVYRNILLGVIKYLFLSLGLTIDANKREYSVIQKVLFEIFLLFWLNNPLDGK